MGHSSLPNSGKDPPSSEQGEIFGFPVLDQRSGLSSFSATPTAIVPHLRLYIFGYPLSALLPLNCRSEG